MPISPIGKFLNEKSIIKAMNKTLVLKRSYDMLNPGEYLDKFFKV